MVVARTANLLISANKQRHRKEMDIQEKLKFHGIPKSNVVLLSKAAAMF